MHYFFFNDRRSYPVVNSKDGQKLLSDKPTECHGILIAWNHIGYKNIMARRFNGLRNVLHRASVINRASAIYNSERKRAVINNSLMYIKGWGKLIAYAINKSKTAERMRGWLKRRTYVRR